MVNKLFYNTTNEHGKKLEEYKNKALSQDEIVLKFFKQNPKKSFTVESVWKKNFNTEDTPITSIRRTMTNLTSSGDLKKLTTKMIGQYGRPVYKWKIINYIKKRKLKKRRKYHEEKRKLG